VLSNRRHAAGTCSMDHKRDSSTTLLTKLIEILH
jgi:hypothetical protein